MPPPTIAPSSSCSTASGIGELPDAAAYGDEGSNTLGNIARQVPLRSRRCGRSASARVASIGDGVRRNRRPWAPAARMAEASAGKDSVTGHWEMMGVVLDRPFPVFPDGFSGGRARRVLAPDRRGVLGNKAASGTAIIDELGPEHMRTGALIVYTSADSVFQIAAHEEIVPVAGAVSRVRGRLQAGRRKASASAASSRGRSSARPGAFTRTANRRDYALPPRGETLLDRADEARRSRSSRSARSRTCSPAAASAARDPHGQRRRGHGPRRRRRCRRTPNGLIFANLVDFDTQYGHRNDVAGYAANLERFDAGWPDCCRACDRTTC